jgi:hypothetical protein
VWEELLSELDEKGLVESLVSKGRARELLTPEIKKWV